MPQGQHKGRGPPASRQQQQQQSAAAASGNIAGGSTTWQRSAGAFSGKAKKAYLKQKRQARAAAATSDDEDSDSDAAACGGAKAAAATPAPAPAAAAAAPGARSSAAAAAAAAPLRYRPLVAVPAASFAVAGTAAAADAPAADTAGTADDAAAARDAAGVVLMPRLDAAEVGFTAEGFRLNMPTRPDWKGVVSSAEELHELEERQFERWQAGLLQAAAAASSNGQQQQLAAPPPPPQPPQQQGQQGSARAGGVGRLSFYEGRLDFWRQLWRTLELSDVLLMILDARAPLLHFSHALYRHITQHHRRPLLLLLNKCDLVPAAAAAAWQAWLQAQLPGVTVVPVSAAPDQASAAARAVLERVLALQVERGGGCVRVGDFVGLSPEELIEASIQRNLHAKRHLPQQQQQRGPPSAAACTDDDSSSSSSSSQGGGSDGGGSDGKGVWSLAPSRAARKAGRRPARRHGQRPALHPGPRVAARCGRGSAGAGGGGSAERASSTEHEGSSGNESEDAEQRQQRQALEELTLEQQLRRNSSSRSTGAAGPAAADRHDAPSPLPWQADSRPVVVGLLGEPNVGKSSTLNVLLGTHRVAVSSHPGRTKHYQTHWMSDRLVLCDCPGIVFPRLDVSLPMQVLFGSYPIASCRDPYAVVAFLAAASWPRLQDKLSLAHPEEAQAQQVQTQTQPEQLAVTAGDGAGAAGGSRGSSDERPWSAWALCEALAAKRHWVLPRSGRLDTYRAANWLLRAALAGRQGLGLAFLPPGSPAANALEVGH